MATATGSSSNRVYSPVFYMPCARLVAILPHLSRQTTTVRHQANVKISRSRIKKTDQTYKFFICNGTHRDLRHYRRTSCIQAQFKQYHAAATVQPNAFVDSYSGSASVCWLQSFHIREVSINVHNNGRNSQPTNESVQQYTEANTNRCGLHHPRFWPAHHQFAVQQYVAMQR